LQLHAPDELLGDALAHLRDFGVEGVEREEVFAQMRRCEQHTKIAVMVVAPDMIGEIAHLAAFVKDLSSFTFWPP